MILALNSSMLILPYPFYDTLFYVEIIKEKKKLMYLKTREEQAKPNLFALNLHDKLPFISNVSVNSNK